MWELGMNTVTWVLTVNVILEQHVTTHAAVHALFWAIIVQLSCRCMRHVICGQEKSCLEILW